MKKGKPDFSNIHTPHFETTEIANQDTALPTKQNKSFATISLETTTFLKRFLLCLMRHKKILIILTAISVSYTHLGHPRGAAGG